MCSNCMFIVGIVAIVSGGVSAPVQFLPMLCVGFVYAWHVCAYAYAAELPCLV